jgi:pSer/pThr/pTyr-binding forkhead associated (FHA) protein
MTETRQIVGHSRHTLPGPHADLPVGFVPLRLCVQAEHLHIDVTCPVAIVGRHSDVDLRFAFPEVSRRHCRLAFEDSQWRIYDLRSLNGIYVNNMPTLETTLYTGDMVRIGCVTLLIESGTPLRLAKENEQKSAKREQLAETWRAS